MQESSTGASHPHSDLPSRPTSALLLATVAVALLLPGAPCRADDTIYRCTGADGSIEFRQYPCHGRDRAEQVELGPDTEGWEAPPKVKRPARKTTRRKTRSPAARARSERRQEERCWSKRQQLEKVRYRLRSGYKAGQGQTLRQRRDEYADYLRRFCR
jgi:hypothetical protein